jgi:CO dehydrogenase/acetyl-CoA synthase alpha subunit
MNLPIVREYTPRPECMKMESTNPHTLKHRKYCDIHVRYYRNHAEDIKQKTRNRYDTDPEYRARCIERAKASYQRRKEQKAIDAN